MFRSFRLLRGKHVFALLAFSAWDTSSLFLWKQQQTDPVGTKDVNITDKFRQLRDKYTAPQYPIVLCHGLLGFDTLMLIPPLQQAFGTGVIEEIDETDESGTSGSVMINYWSGIEDALKDAGAQVVTAKVPPFGSIAGRAELLDLLLQKKFEDLHKKEGHRIKINLVGHLMGGLDSRYLISKLQNENSSYEVVSLTTVGTPHRGSEVADFVMNLVDSDGNLGALCPTAILQLTTEYAAKFNADVLDNPSVQYYSYGALMDISGIRLFRATYEIIKLGILGRGEKNVANDGMVSVELAKWGDYVGTLEGVDHLDLINWTNRVRTVVDTVLFQQPPQFNAIALYLDIAENLSKNGF